MISKQQQQTKPNRYMTIKLNLLIKSILTLGRTALWSTLILWTLQAWLPGVMTNFLLLLAKACGV